MLPSNVQYCTVKGRFLRAIGDGSDAGREPDAVPIEGLTITISADLKPAITRNATSTPPVTIFLEPIICTTDADGVLLGPDGSPDVLIVASDDEDLDPHDWTYKVTLQSMAIGTVTFSFVAPVGETVDLSSVVPVPPSPGADIPAWTVVATAASTARDEAVAASVDAAAAAAAVQAVEATNDGIMTAVVEDAESSFSSTLSSKFAGKDVPPVAPALSPISERIEPLRVVRIQEPNALYATYSRTGTGSEFQKSTNGGTTWVKVSDMPGAVVAISRLTSGTMIAVEQTATTVVSNPRTWRSTDDGATWTEVAAGLKFPPISAQGICEGTDGSVLIAEYGNVGPHAYRIVRSADDGVTWTTVLTTDPAVAGGSDVGHFHSVTFDPYAQRHVTFSDIPIVTGVKGPRIYVSDDDGATWDLLGEASTVDRPNFVSPMYFENYIAWGSDNQINGRVARIKRDDFYAGLLDKVEVIAQLSQKAMYYTFPIRPDVWAVSMAGEHISSPIQSGGGGSTMNEVWLVSNDGAVVSGGLESYAATVEPGKLSALKATFPSYRYDRLDHAGYGWVNTPVGLPKLIAAVPFTQGWEAANKRLNVRSIPYLPRRVTFDLLRGSDPQDAVRFIDYPDGWVEMGNDTAGTSDRTVVRFYDDGNVGFVRNGALVATFSGGRLVSSNITIASATGPRILAGSTSPEGVTIAPPGSIYMKWNGDRGATLWVKEFGSGNTGWYPAGSTSGTSGLRPPTPTVGVSFFDTTIGKPIWWNGVAWVDATGAALP